MGAAGEDGTPLTAEDGTSLPPEPAALESVGRAHPSWTRIGAFSDAVFAFAITLLILTIRMPRPPDPDAGAGLLTLLTRQWQSGLVSGLSFLIVGVNWTNHRIMFAKFARADHVLVWLNLLSLMVGVAIIPIPTAVLGSWLGQPHDQRVAAVFSGLAVTLAVVAYALPTPELVGRSWQWWHTRRCASAR